MWANMFVNEAFLHNEMKTNTRKHTQTHANTRKHIKQLFNNKIITAMNESN